MALFENFPYTNLHQLNLDWLVAEMKKVEDTIKYGPVISVNGLTGEVVLYQEANVRLPDVMNPTQTNWNIFRYLNGHVYGIEFDATGNVYQIQDQYRRKLLTWADIPPESGVISINGKYGVVRLYGSDIQTSGDDTKTVMESIYDLEDTAQELQDSIDDLDELTSTLQTISNAIKNSLAYVENTNIATHNLSAGTYVLWNNGAYKVKSGTNIAIGDTLSSSNLDAIGTKGFINDLNDSIIALNGNLSNLIGVYPLPKSDFVTWFTIYKGTTKWHFVPLLGASRKTISIVSCSVGGQSIPCTLEARLDGGIIVITTWTAGDIDNAVLTLSIS